jgi:hypothetical protein
MTYYVRTREPREVRARAKMSRWRYGTAASSRMATGCLSAVLCATQRAKIKMRAARSRRRRRSPPLAGFAVKIEPRDGAPRGTGTACDPPSTKAHEYGHLRSRGRGFDHKRKAEGLPPAPLGSDSEHWARGWLSAGSIGSLEKRRGLLRAIGFRWASASIRSVSFRRALGFSNCAVACFRRTHHGGSSLEPQNRQHQRQ